MRKRQILWLVPTVIYALFTFWYTDFGGPLTEEEIADYSETLAERMAPDRLQYITQFMRNDTGRQFLMVNNIDNNENPPDVEGAEPGESAAQLMGRYMEHMYAQLSKRASHPVIAGNAIHDALDLVGVEDWETAQHWTTAAMMRYRSRRTFMEIITHPDMQGRHEFKIAALDKTIAYPIEMQLYLSDPRLLLALILLIVTLLIDKLIPIRESKESG
jgi:hypothetical protein|tara:strand:- start:74 stop:721 length:648 start_codon:yes stop_codon:yes gene_type:complete